MEEKIFQMDFAGRPLTVEVGKLAKQSSGASFDPVADTKTAVSP